MPTLMLLVLLGRVNIDNKYNESILVEHGWVLLFMLSHC